MAIAALAVMAVLAFSGLALAQTMLDPFTQDGLDNNWTEDRQFPSDGVTSVSAFGRPNVARIGIDSEETQEAIFNRTEGIKTTPAAQDFGLGVQVDLYLDPDWADKAVRAGFWVVGDEGAGARDNFFAIIEFVNNEDHEGWRVWDSVNGWTNLETDFTVGQWATLVIVLDPDVAEYQYFIDGEQVASKPGGQHFIRELFLNSYNYGLDVFPNLNEDSYAAHWHAGVASVDKDECKDGGWEDLDYRNQGQCIAAFTANERAGE